MRGCPAQPDTGRSLASDSDFAITMRNDIVARWIELEIRPRPEND
jgi:hypothetical protein